ncbi:hypothetical protein [Halobacteriovorax sp. RT-2-4]|uniref:hypothetical protein n=1 Tax=unclassified Halobacteriovorax TaxID=2639665 RepID=UPI0039999F0B
MKNTLKKALQFSSLTTLLLLNVSCVEESDLIAAQKARVNMQMGSYSVAQSTFLDMFFPKAYAAIGSLTLCFKRVRFKLDDTDAATLGEDNVDFNIGEISIDGGVVDLGTLELPIGKTYKRIEFDLESDCAGGKSIDLVNDNGSYSTTDRITIKFSGTFTANDGAVMVLGPQNLASALNSYNGVSTLKDVAEGASGTF